MYRTDAAELHALKTNVRAMRDAPMFKKAKLAERCLDQAVYVMDRMHARIQELEKWRDAQKTKP